MILNPAYSGEYFPENRRGKNEVEAYHPLKQREPSLNTHNLSSQVRFGSNPEAFNVILGSNPEAFNVILGSNPETFNVILGSNPEVFNVSPDFRQISFGRQLIQIKAHGLREYLGLRLGLLLRHARFFKALHIAMGIKSNGWHGAIIADARASGKPTYSGSIPSATARSAAFCRSLIPWYFIVMARTSGVINLFGGTSRVANETGINVEKKRTNEKRRGRLALASVHALPQSGLPSPNSGNGLMLV